MRRLSVEVPEFFHIQRHIIAQYFGIELEIDCLGTSISDSSHSFRLRQLDRSARAHLPKLSSPRARLGNAFTRRRTRMTG